MMTDVDPRATVWCPRCRRTVQVVKILSQRRHNHHAIGDAEYREAHGLPESDTFYLPEWARSIETKAECGHRINVVATLANITIIREWMPIT